MTRFAMIALAAALLSGPFVSLSHAEDGPNLLGVQSAGAAAATTGGDVNYNTNDAVIQSLNQQAQNGQN